jgi:DNA-binding transcriptional ArsR family regulator
MSRDDVFAALANPARRRLLELLIEGPRTAGYLSEQFDLSRPAVSEHLQVLRKAGLVYDRVSGRERHYELAVEPFADLRDWFSVFERYWPERLKALADLLEAEPER